MLKNVNALDLAREERNQMILGIGIDLLDFSQVDVTNKRLIQKVLTANEQEILNSLKNKRRQEEFLGGRFAAKEAFVKALGTGFRNVSFQDIEILSDDLGKPMMMILNEITQLDKSYNIHLSISHSFSAITAIVILEKENH